MFDSMNYPNWVMPSVNISPPVTIPFVTVEPTLETPAVSYYQAVLGAAGAIAETRTGPSAFSNYCPCLSLITNRE